MENREQQILSEIKTMMSTIRVQLELLDAKMAELQQCVDPEEFDTNPIELDIDIPEDVATVVEDDLPFDDVPETEPETAPEEDPEQTAEPLAETVEEAAVETAEEPAAETEVEAEEETEVETEDEAEDESEVEAESEVETESEVEDEPEVEDEVESESEVESEVESEFEEVAEEDDDDDLPGIFDQPIPVYQAAQASPKIRPSVADAMVAEMQAWRTDMPGTPVKDVRSAISLNDRIIFINYLFGEDPLAFQNAITHINTLDTLDQAIEYVKTEHPSWDLNSELVYRFMMAVRRRVK